MTFIAGSKIFSRASRICHSDPCRATALVQTYTLFPLTMQQPPGVPSPLASSLALSDVSLTPATRSRVFIIALARNLSQLLTAFKMKSKPLVYNLVASLFTVSTPTTLATWIAQKISVPLHKLFLFL